MMISSIPTYAGEAAGTAHFIRLDVRAFAEGQSRMIVQGDFLFRDDIVRTAADSSAVFALKNKSTLSMGPMSQVKVDGFALGDEGRPKVVELIRGAFRFMSGSRRVSHEYEVKTPHATISVRGTTFDVRIQNSMTTIVLHEGSVTVCRTECRDMRPGTTLDASSKGLGPVTDVQPTHWTFNGIDRQYIDRIQLKQAGPITAPDLATRDREVRPLEQKARPPLAVPSKKDPVPTSHDRPQRQIHAPGWISIRANTP
jgi:hypothetical protein